MELRAHLGDLVGRGDELGEHHLDRIAGHQEQHAEDGQGHPEQYGHDGEDPPGQVDQHLFLDGGVAQDQLLAVVFHEEIDVDRVPIVRFEVGAREVRLRIELGQSLAVHVIELHRPRLLSFLVLHFVRAAVAGLRGLDFGGNRLFQLIHGVGMTGMFLFCVRFRLRVFRMFLRECRTGNDDRECEGENGCLQTELLSVMTADHTGLTC